MSNVKELNVNNQTYDIVGKAVVDQNNSGTPVKVWTGTKAQYDLLTPDANTIYNITDDEDPTTYANTSLSNLDPTGQAVIDGKVNKSGDTMTGVLSIKKNTNHINLAISGFTKGTIPSSSKYCSVSINDDINDPLNQELSGLGDIVYTADTSGNSKLDISVIKNQAGSTSSSTLNLTVASDGTKSCSFPNTTRVEGQWVKVNTGGDIATGVSPNGSSNLSYTVTQLPNDGHMYEAMISVVGQTDSTSGHMLSAYVYSDFTSGSGCYICVFRAQTRTSSSIYGGGTIILPVTSNRKIYLIRSTGYYGSVDISIKAYRRIGENS